MSTFAERDATARSLVDAAIRETGFEDVVFGKNGAEHVALYEAVVRKIAVALEGQDDVTTDAQMAALLKQLQRLEREWAERPGMSGLDAAEELQAIRVLTFPTPRMDTEEASRQSTGLVLDQRLWLLLLRWDGSRPGSEEDRDAVVRRQCAQELREARRVP